MKISHDVNMDARSSAVKSKTRPYTLKKRAERQAETRQRIVDAAMGLHATVGPAFTTLTMVAERAGVQRHTLYAHFPDERALLLACSATALEQDPLPDPEPWRAVPDRDERLRAGLGAIYAWYGRNEGQAACVLRDAESHELTREIVTLRMGPLFMAFHEVLGAELDHTGQAMLGLALGFHTWRSLVREGGLAPDEAVDAMVRAIGSA
ncbi:AcrR family transcriptional regulator [Amorphus suaedae]